MGKRTDHDNKLLVPFLARQLSSSSIAVTGTSSNIPSVTVTSQPTPEELKTYRTKNAAPDAVGAGIDDSWLAFLSSNSSDNPMWSMASTNIVTSDVPINQRSFNHIAGKLREALRNSIRPDNKASSSTNQAALNATTSKTNTVRPFMVMSES